MAARFVGNVATSGCRSSSQTFGNSFFFNSPWSKPPGLLLQKSIVVFLIKCVLELLPPSAIRVRKNKSATGGLRRDSFVYFGEFQ